MQNNIYSVKFSKVKDEKGDSQVHCVSATLLLKQSGQIQFVSKHPFQLDFTGNYPFTTGSNPIVGTLASGQYQTGTFKLNTVNKLTAYPYNVTLEKGTAGEVSSDPQVIVDPDQPVIFGLLAAAGAGVVAGAIAALLITRK